MKKNIGANQVNKLTHNLTNPLLWDRRANVLLDRVDFTREGGGTRRKLRKKTTHITVIKSQKL